MFANSKNIQKIVAVRMLASTSDMERCFRWNDGRIKTKIIQPHSNILFEVSLLINSILNFSFTILSYYINSPFPSAIISRIMAHKIAHSINWKVKRTYNVHIRAMFHQLTHSHELSQGALSFSSRVIFQHTFIISLMKYVYALQSLHP